MFGFLFLIGYLSGCAVFLDSLFKKAVVDNRLPEKS